MVRNRKKSHHSFLPLTYLSESEKGSVVLAETSQQYAKVQEWWIKTEKEEDDDTQLSGIYGTSSMIYFSSEISNEEIHSSTMRSCVADISLF